MIQFPITYWYCSSMKWTNVTTIIIDIDILRRQPDNYSFEELQAPSQSSNTKV